MGNKSILNNSLAVICGPPVMMKFGTIRILGMGYRDDTDLSLDGKEYVLRIGKCGHCMMGKYFVCKDGRFLHILKIKDQPNIWD
jgi:NAD(P)H-flavin reductase